MKPGRRAIILRKDLVLQPPLSLASWRFGGGCSAKVPGSACASRAGFGVSPNELSGSTTNPRSEQRLGMGRIRRGGYIFISWIGDHPPRHVHVYDDDANFITRMNLETMQPMDVLKVDKRIVDLIRDLQSEGRL